MFKLRLFLILFGLFFFNVSFAITGACWDGQPMNDSCTGGGQQCDNGTILSRAQLASGETCLIPPLLCSNGQPAPSGNLSLCATVVPSGITYCPDGTPAPSNDLSQCPVEQSPNTCLLGSTVEGCNKQCGTSAAILSANTPCLVLSCCLLLPLVQ